MKRGTPRSTTAMFVSPELTWTMPSRLAGLSASSGTTLGVVAEQRAHERERGHVDVGELRARALDRRDGVG